MEPSKVKKTGKPRIPDHLRRRALVSCDRCKKRRIKCLRPAGTDDCQSCLENGVGCESTLPRKTRIYGSVETLSHRYRVLDALIKGLYPDRDTNNLDSLYAIADAHHIQIPVFDEQSVTDEVFSHPPAQAYAVPSPKSSEPSPDQSGRIERSPSLIPKSPVPPNKPLSKVVEEKLVPLPYNGPSHYIGPSSSFGFVLTVRRMVAEFNSVLRATNPDDERIKLSSEFAGSNWSKALEPISKNEDESSDEQDHNLMNPRNAPRKPSLVPGGASTEAKLSRKLPLVQLLPPREVVDTFVVAYFEKVHPNYLLFHRETFQARYEAMWAHSNLLLRDVETGWVCCLWMIIVFGAQCFEDRDKAQSVHIQRHYLEMVQSRLHQIISASTLINVQAILLLQLYQHNCTERNSAFMLLGAASRMAMGLGMHREGTSGGFDELEREVRKRIWWTTYLFEQNQCAVLGRPCGIDDPDVTVSFPNEIMLDGGQSLPQHYIKHAVRVSTIMSDIRRRIYNSPTSRPDSKTKLAIHFLHDLDVWLRGLPPQLRLDYPNHSPKHQRAVIILHLQFYMTQVFVSRPFILRKVGVELARKMGKHVRSQDLDDEELRLSHACCTYSENSISLLLQLLVTGMFDGVAWMDAYYVYHSVFVVALDFLARPWNETESVEDASRKKAVRDIMAAMQNVKLCPTFTILTQVSFQLAKIVGIFDPPAQPPSLLPLQCMSHPPPPSTLIPPQVSLPLPQPGMEHVVTSWFQNKPDDVSNWDLRDFFGADGYVGPSDQNMFNMTQTIYGNRLPEEEVMPPNLAYTQWGAIDTPFAVAGSGLKGKVRYP